MMRTLRPHRRHTAAVLRLTLLALIPIVGLISLACEDEEQQGPEVGVAIEDILNDPSAYIGQTVTVTGDVENVEGTTVVTLSDEELYVLMSESTSLRFFEDVGSPYTDNTLVVTGDVVRYDPPMLATEYGITANLGDDFLGDPVLVATDVEVLPD